MTVTDEKPETSADEAPTEATVEAPAPVEVGDVVVKPVYPQIYDGLVLAISTLPGGDEAANLVGRREEGGAWTLIQTLRSSLVRRDPSAGDVPGIAEIGAALAAKQADMEASAQARRAADVERLEAVHALDAYKTRVRDQIVSTGDSYSWDDDEVNELLDNLGLDPMTREFSVNVDVTATQSVYVTVQANNLDEAIEQVEDDSDLVRDAIEAHEWSWDSSDYSVDRYNSGPAD